MGNVRIRSFLIPNFLCRKYLTFQNILQTVVTHVLTRRRTDIWDVGESTLTVGEQTVGETTRRRNDLPRNSRHLSRNFPRKQKMFSCCLTPASLWRSKKRKLINKLPNFNDFAIGWDYVWSLSISVSSVLHEFLTFLAIDLLALADWGLVAEPSNSGWFACLLGKRQGPRSSSFRRGLDGIFCPGRRVNIRVKSSLLKCKEQIFDCLVGSHLALLCWTKFTHFCRLLMPSSRG